MEFKIKRDFHASELEGKKDTLHYMLKDVGHSMIEGMSKKHLAKLMSIGIYGIPDRWTIYDGYTMNASLNIEAIVPRRKSHAYIFNEFGAVISPDGDELGRLEILDLLNEYHKNR